MKKLRFLPALAALIIAAGLLAAVNHLTAEYALRQEDASRRNVFATLLPGAESFTEEAYTGDDSAIARLWTGEGGCVIETVTDAYSAPVILWVGINDDGSIAGVYVRSIHETYGLGQDTRNESFTAQFKGQSGTLTIGETVDAIAGATVTSKAVVKGVNAATGYMTGVDSTSSATEWGDW